MNNFLNKRFVKKLRNSEEVCINLFSTMLPRNIHERFVPGTGPNLSVDKQNRRIVSWLQFIEYPFAFIPIIEINGEQEPNYNTLFCSYCSKWISFAGTIANFRNHCQNCQKKSKKNSNENLFKKFFFYNALPFVLIEDCDLRKIFPELPCRQTLTSNLFDLYGLVENEILNSIETYPMASISYDEWCDYCGRRYMGFTIFLINGVNFQRIYLPLVKIACIRCGANEMFNIFNMVIEKYKLKNKLICASSDTCNAMAKLADMIRNSYDIPWMPCICHILDLLIEAFMKNSEEILDDVFEFHRSWVHSTQLTTYLEECNAPLKRIPKDCSTRWTSYSRIVNALLTLMPYIDSFCRITKKECPDRFMVLKLECIQQLFYSYEKAILELQSESFGIISKVIPYITKITNLVCSLPACFDNGKVAYVQQLNDKWNKFSPFWNPLLYAAAYLNPSLNWSSIMNEEMKIQVKRFLLTKMMEEPRIEEIAEPPSDDIFHKNIDLPDPMDEVKMYELMASSIAHVDLEDFWRNVRGIPLLQSVAIKILGIQITSAPTERLFSCASTVVGKKRTKISSKTLIAATFIKGNKSFTKKFL